jgi:hypothetical protein
MALLEQPPPDAPAPPPDEAVTKSHDKAFLIFGIGILSVLVSLIYMSQPVILRAARSPHRAQALNNIRQIGMSLSEFDAEYGKFPDASTIAALKRNTGTSLALGSTSSNELFRQLIAAGLKSEKPFWMHSAVISRQPDDVFTPGKALVPGECAFGYVAGQSSADDPGRPLVFGPLVPGTMRFDPTIFGGKAIILRLDNSACCMNIDEKTGKVMFGGYDLFDASHPVWGGKVPDIKLPE